MLPYSPKQEVILISTTGLYPFHKGAPARLFKVIGEELAIRGLSITFICLSPPLKDNDTPSIEWTKVFNKNPLVKVWHRAKARTFLSRRWQELAACIFALKHYRKNTIFLFNSAPYSFFSILVVLAKCIGIRTAYIAHGGIFTENENSISNRLTRINLKAISFAIDGIVTVSNAFGTYLKTFFPAHHIHTIHNGFDCSCLPKDFKIKKNKQDDKFTIFYMGRLEQVKCLDILISAFSHLHKKYDKSNIIIAGTGQHYDNLKRQVTELNLAPHVSFVGFINQVEKKKYFEEADVFVLPSIFETFGMVLLEAMCFKVPVVASRVGGIPEIIEDGVDGILCDPGNAHELFKKLEELYLDQNKREQLADNAYRKVTKKFSTSRMGSDYFNYIQQLINNQ
ncbi:MAG: glycosyltransferase family 4 protein [Desulfobulbaceae bacterium]|nr:glycosyltransferase family 4 protein [Desulfobulbaceae bacterium]